MTYKIIDTKKKYTSMNTILGYVLFKNGVALVDTDDKAKLEKLCKAIHCEYERVKEKKEPKVELVEETPQEIVIEVDNETPITEEMPDFDSFTAKKLKALAKDKGIVLPTDIQSKVEIAKFLKENWK